MRLLYRYEPILFAVDEEKGWSTRSELVQRRGEARGRERGLAPVPHTQELLHQPNTGRVRFLVIRREVHGTEERQDAIGTRPLPRDPIL